MVANEDRDPHQNDLHTTQEHQETCMNAHTIANSINKDKGRFRERK